MITTGTLFAALEVATEKGTAAARHPRHKEFLRFVRNVAAAHRGVELHVVLDNYGATKHPEVRRWQAEAEDQQVTVHVMQTGRSWLTMAEIFFGMVNQQASRRGTFRSAKELTGAIGTFIETSSNRRQVFAWIKNAPQPHVKDIS
jgi:hypothetical protein